MGTFDGLPVASPGARTGAWSKGGKLEGSALPDGLVDIELEGVGSKEGEGRIESVVEGKANGTSNMLDGVAPVIGGRENGLVGGGGGKLSDGATEGAALGDKLTLNAGGMMGGMGIAVVFSVDFPEPIIATTTNTRHADTITRIKRIEIAKNAFILDVGFGSPSTLLGIRFLVKDNDILAVDMTDATSSGMAARSRVVDVHKSLVFGPHGCMGADGL